MPRAKDVSGISDLQRGSHLDPYRILDLPVRSWLDDYGVYRSGIIDDELEEIMPDWGQRETRPGCIIPELLWLIKEMHADIQELKKKVNK